MDPSDLRAFAGREWAAVAAAKVAYWAEQYLRRGPEAARQASTLLWEHARRVQPAFPAEVDRSRDLADHIALRQRLDVAARALARR